MVKSFTYPERVLTTSDNNWMAVVANLLMSRRKWVRLSRILGWEGSDPRTSRTLYKTVTQVTLLFVMETWAMTPRIRRILGIFNHRVACCSTEIHPKRGTSMQWEYPYLEAIIATVGLEDIETYGLLLHNIITQYIATRTILVICMVK